MVENDYAIREWINVWVIVYLYSTFLMVVSIVSLYRLMIFFMGMITHLDLSFLIMFLPLWIICGCYVVNILIDLVYWYNGWFQEGDKLRSYFGL